MKITFKFLNILLLYVGLTTSLFAQPANDLCGAATPITVGVGSCNSILYTNVAATTIGNPATPACWLPNSMSHTVWFSFVATSADIEISTNFGGTLANTQIAVYSGSCGGLIQIACQEDVNTSGGLFHTNLILHGLTINNTYYIAIDGNGNTTGTFGVCAQETLPIGPVMPTQDCTTSQNLCNLNSIVVPNGVGGVGLSQEFPSCFGAPGERSANWYSFTAATSGNLCFAVTPNGVIDYDFAVYNTTTSCPGTELSCNWDATTGALGTTGLGCAGIQCNTCLAVVAGQTYSILIDRYTASSSSGFTMNFAGTTATFGSPNPTFTATTVCVGTATQFTNTTNGNFTYNWNFGDGFTSNLKNPTHTYATNGAYTVTLLLTAVPGGCQNAISRTVTVIALPIVDAGIAPPICSGGCVNLSGSSNALGSVNPTSFFNANPYAIPDNSLVGVYAPIAVSGVFPTAISSSSIASVCLNITHAWDADLVLYLQCPNGTRIQLSANNGGSGVDYTNTCFTPTAVTPISSGSPPFTGTFIPVESFSLLNGCTTNGTWQLFVIDDDIAISGNISSWTITFNNNLPAFSWSPTTAMTNSTTLTPTVCPTSTTTYTLTANNGVGCTTSDTVTVTVGGAPAAPILTPTQPTCAVATGTVTITAVAGITFSFDGGAYSGTLVYGGLAAGSSHTVFAQNASGCISVVANITLNTQPASPATPILTPTQPTCAVATGTITLTAVAGITFSFDGGAYSATLVYGGLAAGSSHTVFAQNASGCISVVANITLNAQPATPASPIVTPTQPTCAVATGTITITAVAGITFSFDGGAYSGTLVYGGLTAGSSHTVFAQNASGCISVVANITLNAQPATPASPILTPTEPTCAVGTGTITITAVAGITFSFDGGAYSGTLVYGGLAAGSSHTVFAQNAAGCISAVSNSTLNAQPATPASPILTPTQPTCAVATGTVSITAVAGITFSFDGGAYSGTLVYGGLAAGSSHTVFAQNAAGCISAVSNSTLNAQPATPTASILTPTQPTCAVATGTVSITAVAGITFSFDGGAYSGTLVYGGLAAGSSHTVFAQNAAGCISVVSNSTLNAQPATPTSPILTPTQPTCAVPTGTITITAVAGITFSFDGGAYSGTLIYGGLTAGSSHTVFAQNAAGCISAVSNSTLNAQPATPASPILTSTQPTCAVPTGTITITAVAGITFSFDGGAYSGTLVHGGLAAGSSHTVFAQNAAGCISAVSNSTLNAQPATPASPNVTTPILYCENALATTLNANGTNLLWYTNANGGFGNPIPPTPDTSIIGTTNYYVSQTANGCESPRTNIRVIVSPNIIPVFTQINPICSGYTLSPLPTTSNNGVTGTWSPPLDNTITTTYFFTPTTGLCATIIPMTITVYFLPQGIALAPLNYCDPNNDGFGVFDLTQVINSLPNGNTYTVSFHETITDATIDGTSIPNPSNYDNIDVDNQTIYVRVESNTASFCYVILTLDLIVNKTPEATQPGDYHVCDNNYDGFTNFDLTTITLQVLGIINPTTHTVNYYTSLPNAQLNTNPINNLTSYTNQIVNTQTIWVRVQNSTTGCYDIVTLQLFVDPLPQATQPNYPSYNLCDKISPLGYEVFNLGSQINAISLGQTGMNVTFHFSQADANADANALPLLYQNVAIYVQTIWIRTENANTGCFVLSTMDLRVDPLPTPIPPIAPYVVCDTNQYGYGEFNLNTLTNDILQGANYTITYHETSIDAQLGDFPLSSPYDNIYPFIQFIYVAAVDPITGCRMVIPIELNVEPSPIMPTILPNLIQCDQDNNNQNLSTTFDLTLQTQIILAAQTTAASNYTVTYYTSLANAQLETAPIISPTTYLGYNTQPIWVRIEHNLTQCFAIGTFQLEVNSPLALTTPLPLSVCDSDFNPNNLFTIFDLTIRNNSITQGQLGYTVTYYPSFPVTTTSIAIADPTSFTNTIPAVQTLGVMVTSPQGCISYTTLDIRVLPIPNPNTANILALAPQCDVNNTGDMMEVFNLTTNAAYIINSDPNLTLHYYPTYIDAVNQISEILNPTAALVGQNVWIKVQNNRVDYQGNNCFVLVEQRLKVNPLPIIIQPISVVQNCDNDTDGFTTFDLAATTASLLGSGQSASDFTISYYTSAANAQVGTNAIANSNLYTNVSSPETIFVRVVNNTTGCVNYGGQFDIIVNPKPTATSPSAFTTCDDAAANDGFYTLDLNSYITGIIGAQTAVVTTFYDLQLNAQNGTNAITDLTNYQAYTHILWIRVEDAITGCYQLTSFNITVEELAEPFITSSSDTICVEWGTNTLLSGLTLDSGITNPNYTFAWSFNGAFIPTATAAMHIINTDAAGDYTVVATSTNPPMLGCPSAISNTFTVIQSGPPVADNLAYTVSNAFNENQIITINVLGFGLYEYSLDDGLFQSSNICEYAALGTHTVRIKDSRGNTSCGEIIIGDIQTINYPHYFTPNGDGIHENWNVVGLNQSNARIYIFDRYGKLLKQISSNGEGWNGTYNGYLLPSTDYWFTVEYFEGNAAKIFKSHFSLKR